TLKLWLDNELMAQKTIQGRFAIEITPSPELATGRHRLTLEVAPLGRYQGASMSLDFNVSRIPTQADIEMALFVVLPESLKVSGRVYHREGFLEDARVTLAFRDFSTTTRTASYGGFSATIEVPLDPFLFGLQELIVTVAPAEPWYAPLETTQRIIVINPAHIGLLLAALLSVGLLTYRRGRAGVADRPERGAASVKSRPGQPAAIPPRRRRCYDLSGINGRIILAYLDALTAVEKKTGITLAPQTTLREFLRAAALPPPLAVPFAELTTLTEVAMYSGRQPDRDSAVRAGRLADVIKKGGL
ncbi:MAG: DUF4129 domain-containing protein, partial [Dehalococcoidales bacterium]